MKGEMIKGHDSGMLLDTDLGNYSQSNNRVNSIGVMRYERMRWSVRERCTGSSLYINLYTASVLRGPGLRTWPSPRSQWPVVRSH